jgi:hypothetical protein
MCRALYVSMLLMCTSTCDALGLSIAIDGSSMPFTVTHQQLVQQSLEQIIQVVNDSGNGVTVLSWQLQLEIRPLAGSQGEVLFDTATTPPESLFGQSPGPISDLANPSNTILAFDSDTTDFDGELVPDQMSRNILQISHLPIPDTVGTFQLIMPEFDADNPESGSSWFAADAFAPVAFANSTPSGFDGFVLLGTINITQGPVQGDYDSDGVVGPLDYDRWRANFANSVNTPGEDADGNRDSIIDAADYIIWRANLPIGQGTGDVTAEIGVPEPTTRVYTVIGMAASLGCWRRGPRREVFGPHTYRTSSSVPSKGRFSKRRQFSWLTLSTHLS